MIVQIIILLLAIISAGSAFSNFSVRSDPVPPGTKNIECERKWDARNSDRFRAGGSFNVFAAMLLLISIFLPEPYIYYMSTGSLLVYAMLNGLMYYDMILPVHPQC